MKNITIRKITDEERPWAKKFLTGHWGSPIIIVHGQQYSADELSALVAVDENSEKIGLLTYDIHEGDCQIVTLNSIVEKEGVGKKLIIGAKNIAIDNYCKRLWLITTNDNMEALKYYQKFGFSICAIRINEIENSRKFKPQIPKKGLHDIPIRDEIELEYFINQ